MGEALASAKRGESFGQLSIAAVIADPEVFLFSLSLWLCACCTQCESFVASFVLYGWKVPLCVIIINQKCFRFSFLFIKKKGPVHRCHLVTQIYNIYIYMLFFVLKNGIKFRVLQKNIFAVVCA